MTDRVTTGELLPGVARRLLQRPAEAAAAVAARVDRDRGVPRDRVRLLTGEENGGEGTLEMRERGLGSPKVLGSAPEGKSDLPEPKLGRTKLLSS